MEQEIQRRKRAVRLKQDALAMLTVALQATWQQNPQHRKLTREERARILGVSLSTAQRIIKNQGADRASLSVAFKSVGLDWSDSFCESANDDAEATVIPATTSTPRKSPFRPLVIAGACVLSIFAVLSFKPSRNPPSDRDWQQVYFESYDEAEVHYNRAQYREARVDIHRAISIARERENAPRLASSLRLAGDLEAASGNYRLAYARYKESLGIREGLQNKDAYPALEEALGSVELKQGNWKSARNHFLRSHDLFLQSRDWTGVAMASRGLGRASHLMGNYVQADYWYNRGLYALTQVEKPDLAMDIRSLRALLLHSTGKSVEAKKVLEDAIRYWVAKRHPRWVATMRMRYATVLEDKDEAKALLETARKDFASLGDLGGVAECTRLEN
ncbi:MAG TPA: tetratricopeptide repeat protein [Fimbriimonadaceae bacterium]|nr:tetratricopeptide repeat protein [Fimbriimonadaceae bacterium]